MKPIEFITDSADEYNMPVGAVMTALQKDLRIVGADCEYAVLSYYFDNDSKRMVLDIQQKKTSKKKSL